MHYEFTVNGKKHTVSLGATTPTSTVTVDDKQYAVDWLRVEEGVVSLLLGERSYVVCVARSNGGLVVKVDGVRFSLDRVGDGDEAVVAGRGAVAASGKIKAPMPGPWSRSL